MLLFVIPAALLAAAGLIVPVLIHLWRPPARTVRLGSLRFLISVPGRRLRDLRWRDRFLLLVRVALLIALAVLLAQPLWVHLAQGPQRWALRSSNATFDASTRQVWNGLLAQGYQPRWLAPRFPDAGGDTPMPTGAAIDAWSLIREADARIPTGSKLTVFAPPRLSMLQGARPVLSHSEATWISTPSGDAIAPPAWLESLSLARDGRGLRARIGSSSEASTPSSMLLITLPLDATSVSDPATRSTLELRKTNESFAGRLSAPTPEPWTPARVWRPVRAAIVHGPSRAEDARYVAAAIRAAGEVADREITLDVREETTSTILPEADWVFRIGVAPLSAPLSRVLAENNVNVVTDAPLDAVEDASPSWFVAPQNPADVNAARLWKRVVAARDARSVIWSDGFGSPLLIFSREGRAERWQFLSRFHPEWNDWVRSGAFPGWMRTLLLRDVDALDYSTHDRRLADARQVLLARAGPEVESISLSQPADRTTGLHAWIWALVALLLAAERWLSLRPASPRPAAVSLAPKSEPGRAEVAR